MTQVGGFLVMDQLLPKIKKVSGGHSKGLKCGTRIK